MTMLIIWLFLSSCRMIHDAAKMLCNENKISWTVCMSVLLTNTAESFSGSSLKLFTLSLARCESTPSLKANWNKVSLSAPRHAGVGRGSGITAPFILILGNRWRWFVSYTPPSAALPEWNDWDILSSCLGKLQSRSGCLGEEIHILSLPGIEPRFLGCPSRSLVIIPAEPCRPTDDSCNCRLIKISFCIFSIGFNK
jgi:hypothetical protein